MFHLYANGKLISSPLDEERIVLQPRLTLEMGKAGSLQFRLPSNHQMVQNDPQAFRPMKTVVTVDLDGVEIFRGRVLSNSRDFNNMRTIYCEGNLAYLVDSVQRGERYSGSTHELFRRIIDAHNARIGEAEKQFTVGDITVSDRTITLLGKSENGEGGVIEIESWDQENGYDYRQIAIDSIADEWDDTFNYLETCLLDNFGGYLRTRRIGDVTYIDWLEDYSGNATQEIEFGRNLLDLTEEQSVDDLVTVLIPLGDENLTVASVNDGLDEIVNEDAVNTYGRIVKTHVFDGVSDPNTLLENGLLYLAKHSQAPATITVKAVDLHMIDKDIRPIYLGDKAFLSSLPHSIVNQFVCTKIEYDLENPANNTYTFGQPKPSLSEHYRRNAKAQAASSKRGGGGGGGGGGGKAAEEVEERIKEFYDAFVDFEKDIGRVTIGALYEKYLYLDEENKRLTEQQNQVQLFFDAANSEIKLSNLLKQINKNEETIRNQSATIDMLLQEHQSVMEFNVGYSHNVSYVDAMGNEVAVPATHAATIRMIADAVGSSTEVIANKIKMDGKIIDIGAPKSKVDEVASGITNINSRITSINSDVINLGNSVQVTNRGINALQGQFDKLITGNLTADVIRTNVLASKVSITKDGVAVATQDWTNAKLNNYVSSSTLDTKLKGYALSDHTHSWTSITDKPSAFKPTSHTHSFSGSSTLAWGHTHVSATGGVKNYRAKTITISGTTGSN